MSQKRHYIGCIYYILVHVTTETNEKKQKEQDDTFNYRKTFTLDKTEKILMYGTQTNFIVRYLSLQGPEVYYSLSPLVLI